MPAAGRIVGGYELVREVGRGGMAVVYLARQLALNRAVALKELSRFQLGASESAERFFRESRMAGSLNHPNIVMVHEYFEAQDIPYIAMEYAQRGSLRPYVGRLTLAQLAGVMEGVLAGLAHAEQARIVHRDLKPENILVTSDGRVKITDFGIAKASQMAGMTTGLTATGSAVGTPTYMAPEQAMADPVGAWTDLYSVGVMAYEQLTGRPPFHGAESPMVMLMRHVNDPIPPAVEANPNIDPALSEWIDRLLVKVCEERTQSAVEAWEGLEEIIERLLGPRWRRLARLDEPEQTTDTPRPLTPAPFKTNAVDTPSVSPAAPEGAFVTFDPSSPEPAAPAPPAESGWPAPATATARAAEPAADAPEPPSAAQAPSTEPDVAAPAQPFEQDPLVSETGFVTFVRTPPPEPTGKAAPEQTPEPKTAAAPQSEPAPVEPDAGLEQSGHERASELLDAAPAVPREHDPVLIRPMATNPDDRHVSAGDLGAVVSAGAESRVSAEPARNVGLGAAATHQAERERGETERTDHNTTVRERPAKEGSPPRRRSPRRPSRPWLMVLAACALTAALAALLIPGSASPTGWLRLPNLPEPVQGAGVAAYQGDVWVVGGAGHGKNAVTDVYRYHPGDPKWRSGPFLPAARLNPVVVSTGQQLYVIGGFGPDRRAVQTVFRLDRPTGTWQTDAPMLPEARGGGAGAWDGTQIVFAGGVPEQPANDDVWTLAPGGQWRAIGKLQQDREYLAAATDGMGKVWFIGGDFQKSDKAYPLVDVVKNGQVRPGPNIDGVRRSAAVGVGSGFCTIAGHRVTGKADPNSPALYSRQVQCQGIHRPIPALDTPRAGLGATVLDNKIYVVGGYSPGHSASTLVEALDIQGAK